MESSPVRWYRQEAVLDGREILSARRIREIPVAPTIHTCPVDAGAIARNVRIRGADEQ